MAAFIIVCKILFELLKLASIIVGKCFKFNAEEFALFKERMEIATNLIRKAVSGEMDALSEQSYLSNLEWEQKQRYKIYKEQATKALSQGFGFVELTKVDVYGMGARTAERQEKIVKILAQPKSIEEKAQLIAQALIAEKE